jgi:hypothetical protein
MKKTYLYIGNDVESLFEAELDIWPALKDGVDLESRMAAMHGGDGIFIQADMEHRDGPDLRGKNIPYGVQIGQALRLMGLKTPILFFSYQQLKNFLEKKPGSEIMTAVGHGYIELPAGPAEMIDAMEKINSLDELELFDIQNAYCRKEGMIDDYVHSLDREGSKILPQQEFIDQLNKIAAVYGENPVERVQAFTAAFPVITQSNLQKAKYYVKAYGEDLVNSNSMTRTGKNSVEPRNYAILWLDDDLGKEHMLGNLLEDSLEMIYCSNAETAMCRLEEDWRTDNRIMVLMADYRLYELLDGVRVQQKIQGYKLMNEVAGSGRMISLVALSALPKKVLFRSFRYFNTRTEIYSKDYLANASSIRLLAEELLRLGDENQEAILSMPDEKTGWKTLSKAYRQYRHSVNYIRLEKELSERAKAYAHHFNRYGQFPEFVKVNKSALNFGGDPAKNIELLLKYLFARRLALWLGAVKRYSNEEIVALLLGAAKNDYRIFLSQYLGLRINDFPFGLTIEEKKWFQYEIGVPIYRDILLGDHILEQVSQLFQSLIRRKPVFQEHLKNSGLTLGYISRKQRGEIFFDQDYKPGLQNFAQLRNLYRSFSAEKLFSRTDLSWLANRINFAINIQIIGKECLAFSLVQLSKFFKQAVHQETEYLLGAAQLKKMTEYLGLFQSGYYLREIADPGDLELYTKVFLAIYDLENENIRKEQITADLLSEKVTAQVRSDRKEAAESLRLTRYNYDRNDKSTLDYRLPEDW